MEKYVITDLYYARCQLDILSPESEDSAKRQVLQQKAEIIALIQNGGEVLIEELFSFRLHLMKKLVKPPSPAYLCADFLNITLVEGFWQFALDDWNMHQYQGFCYNFDVAYGMSTTLNRIFMAESYLETKDDSIIKDLTAAEQYNEHQFGMFLSIGDSMEKYTFAHASAKWAADLYDTDSTGSGFYLLDTYVKQLRTDPTQPLKLDQIPPGVNHKLIVTGAEYIKDLYKAVYPFSIQVTQKAT